jgi:hypothetical protein
MNRGETPSMAATPPRHYIAAASPLLTDEAALDAAARVHADWEGYPDSHGSIRAQAAQIVAAFVGAMDREALARWLMVDNERLTGPDARAAAAALIPPPATAWVGGSW